MKKTITTLGALMLFIISIVSFKALGKQFEKKKNSINEIDTMIEKQTIESQKLKIVAISLNGKYINSEKSELTISNWYEGKSFKFSYSLEHFCEGISEKGLATFEDKKNAFRYDEEGNKLEHFHLNDDGSIELFNLSEEMVGMECIRYFDTHFVKK
jgi:hypothetical protein